MEYNQRVASALITYPFQGEGDNDREGQDPGLGVTQNLFAMLEHFGLYEGEHYETSDLLAFQFIENYDNEDGYNEATSGCSDDFCKCSQSQFWAGVVEEIDCSTLRVMYWYHPDYLGNTEFITDLSGDAYQYIWYSPWGEGLVDQYSNTGSYSSPYRFNAKELDPETNNYYYGARYYNPQTSIWYSIDPLAREYPSLSPYAFVANNPIMLIDPDGRQIDIVGEDGNTTTYKPGMEYKGKDEFTRKTVEAYNKAYTESSEAKSHIEKTVDADNIYSVEKGDENKFTPIINIDAATGKETSGGGVIKFNPDGSDIPVQSGEGSLTSKMENNPVMGLIHETIHASRHEDGKWDGVSVFGSTGIRTEELETSHAENIVRSQMGLPLRTHYQVANMPDGSKKGTGFNLLKYRSGIISNYLWKSNRTIYKY